MKQSKKRFTRTGWILTAALLLAACAARTPAPEETDAVEEIEKKWEAVKLSSTTEWVDYAPDFETRSRIDFIKGNIDVETVLPEDKHNLEKSGQENIVTQVRKIFTEVNLSDTVVVSDQVLTRKGDVVNRDNLDAFIQDEVVPGIRTEKKTYQSKDGVRRIKMTTHLNMRPAHLKIRAARYAAAAGKQARRFGLEHSLIMAMIHVESHFNPLARSYCGALGLMQVIPKFAGREAYKFLKKKNIIPSEKYVYQPDNNIELGAAYYHLLETRIFKNIRDRQKRRYMALCAYNLGPYALKRIVSVDKANQISRNDLLSLLDQRLPDQTRNFLKDVLRLEKRYATDA